MQIQLDWVRYGEGSMPRSVKPLAKGTNTLVFEDPDPTKVIVFMLCDTKRYWWKESDLITNPDENHWFKDIETHGYTTGGYEEFDLTLWRVQAKKLFKPANGSKQKREIAATVKAMDNIYAQVLRDYPANFKESVKTHRRIRACEFWQRLTCTELPTKELADFAVNYYIMPDIAPRNALVDADGEIQWSDMFCSEDILEFVHTRKSNPNGRY